MAFGELSKYADYDSGAQQKTRLNGFINQDSTDLYSGKTKLFD